MMKQLSSIRYSYIRSHLNSLFLTAISMFSIVLFIYTLFSPRWLTINSIFFFTVIYLLLALIFSVYAGFKSSSQMKEHVDSISVLITQFSNGNYQSNFTFEDNNELTRIGNELNELGSKMQSQVRSLQRMADENANLAKTAHKAAAIEERQRLARDLHDAVSQQLFALTMMSEAALAVLDKNPELAKKQISEVANAALHAQTEMRALLLHLRPVHLSGEPLVKGIHSLIKELEQKSQVKFLVQMDNDLDLSNTKEEHIFRIIQESLSNILRHAKATTVRLNLSKRTNELFLHISDNGVGFDLVDRSDLKASYGLKTMEERTGELGGHFSIRSNKSKGTYIDIRVPC